VRKYEIRLNRTTAKSTMPSSVVVVIQARSGTDARKIAENQNPGYRAVAARSL